MTITAHISYISLKKAESPDRFQGYLVKNLNKIQLKINKLAQLQRLQ